MIFLEIQNRALEEVLLWKFENAKQGGKHEKFDHILTDFDGVIIRVHTSPDDKSKLMVSVCLHYSDQLRDPYAIEFLRKEYGSYLCTEPEPDMSLTLLYELNNLPDNYELLAQQASFLKRNCFAAVFDRFLAFHALGEEAVGCEHAVLHYREDESLYIQAQGDRITVIFSTLFKDPDDVVLSKVFLQELVEVRRRTQQAPQVLYSQTTPPAELLGTDAVMGDNVAYITFVLFPRHLTPTVAPRTINLIHSFRNYLHYHLKCSKGYVHQRMRAKTAEFLKILNRARPHHSTVPVIHLGTSQSARFPTTRTSSSSLCNAAVNNHVDNDTDADCCSENGSPLLPAPPEFFNGGF